MQVTFKFDKEKDAWNIWDKCNRQSSFGNDWSKSFSPKLIEICKGKKFEKCKKDILELNNKFYDSGFIDVFLAGLRKLWAKREKEFFKRLENITGKKYNQKLTCYVTTIGICPYDLDNGWFMCSAFNSFPGALSTCGHEIMHFHFHKYNYPSIEKKIGNKKTADLKEALSILLNLEFKDLFFSQDKGYPNHQELRKFIFEQWKKEQNYDKLLEKCVEYLKNK